MKMCKMIWIRVGIFALQANKQVIHKWHDLSSFCYIDAISMVQMPVYFKPHLI